MLFAYLIMGVVVGVLLHQGLAPLSRWLPAHRREEQHDELAGHFMGVVAVIYAVLVAFVVVTAWQGRADAISIATQEQHDVDDLFHLLEAHNTPKANAAMLMLRYYAMYTQGEWYQMRIEEPICTDPTESTEECVSPPGAVSSRANELAECVRQYVFGLQASYQGRPNADESVKMAEAFSEDRAERRLRYQDRTLQPVLWLSFVLGAFILVGMTYFVKGQGHRAQLVRTTALFGMMGMMISLGIIFDRPFVGNMQVTPDAWKYLVSYFDADLSPERVRGINLTQDCGPLGRPIRGPRSTKGQIHFYGQEQSNLGPQ